MSGCRSFVAGAARGDVSLLPADGDGGDKAVASTGDVRDETPARVAIAERSAKRGDVNSDARFFDEGVGPHTRKQLLLADHLTRPLQESEQDVARAAAKTHGRVAFEEQTLRRKQAKRPESDDLIRGFSSWLLRHRRLPRLKPQPTCDIQRILDLRRSVIKLPLSKTFSPRHSRRHLELIYLRLMPAHDPPHAPRIREPAR